MQRAQPVLLSHYFLAYWEMFQRDIAIIFKIVTSCLTAGFLIFFISALSGEDLLKNNAKVNELEYLLTEITDELNGGIDIRTQQLGEAPTRDPYRRFYSAELAKELHEVSYLTEKQKIMFDTYSVRDFETKSKRLVAAQIISIPQQAKPNIIGQIELRRLQL